jgi:hypothetical protein
MTGLTINPATAISSILLLISFFMFIFAYNKQIKNKVEKSDLTDLKNYVDQQDKSVHHRIDEVNERVSHLETNINRKLDLLINKLIK